MQERHVVELWADLARTKKRRKRKSDTVNRNYALIVLRRILSAWVNPTPYCTGSCRCTQVGWTSNTR